VRWHFLGSARIDADKNGVHARAVFDQPGTKVLVERAIAGLARSAGGDAAGAALVRALLEESLRVESFGALRGEPGTPGPEWLLALRLGAGRAQAWVEQWEAFGRATGFAAARSAVKEDWFIGGLRRAEPADLEPWQARVAAARAAGGEPAWLEIHADLARLAGTFGWPSFIAWPRAQVAVTGRGANVRTTAEFALAAPLKLRLADWDVPTNTVREPLLSFTALQGTEPWFSTQAGFQELAWPAPNQVFAWAQSLAPYATHFAWRLPEAAERIPAAQEKLKPVLCALAPWLNLGELEYLAEAKRLNWRGLPLVVPFLTPAADSGFALAGLFPLANPTDPGPPELYAQLWGRTNLVYYHWELTQPRLGDWEALDMVYTMIGGYMPPASNSVARAWLRDTNVTSHLGNCVTEVTVASPTELRAVRNSALGLTAFELFRVALWVEGEKFPRRTPPQPVQFSRPRGARTNAPAARP